MTSGDGVRLCFSFAVYTAAEMRLGLLGVTVVGSKKRSERCTGYRRLSEGQGPHVCDLHVQMRPGQMVWCLLITSRQLQNHIAGKNVQKN